MHKLRRFTRPIVDKSVDMWINRRPAGVMSTRRTETGAHNGLRRQILPRRGRRPAVEVRQDCEKDFQISDIRHFVSRICDSDLPYNSNVGPVCTRRGWRWPNRGGTPILPRNTPIRRPRAPFTPCASICPGWTIRSSAPRFTATTSILPKRTMKRRTTNT